MKFKKYKIIKEFPDSEKLGTIIQSTCYYDQMQRDKYPEFYEEVKEKEYEILELKDEKGFVYTLKEDGKYSWVIGNKGTFTLAECLEEFKNTIHKVKVLSTSEEFQIGDVVTNPAGHKFTITSFYLDCNKEHMLVGSNCGAGHVGIQKIKKYIPKFLFESVDGVDIFEDSKYWVVNSDILVISEYPIANIHLKRGLANRVYSSKEKAEEYVAKKKEEQMLDKSLLSYNEVYKVFHNMNYEIAFTEQIKELVKSKM